MRRPAVLRSGAAAPWHEAGPGARSSNHCRVCWRAHLLPRWRGRCRLCCCTGRCRLCCCARQLSRMLCASPPWQKQIGSAKTEVRMPHCSATPLLRRHGQLYAHQDAINIQARGKGASLRPTCGAFCRRFSGRTESRRDLDASAIVVFCGELQPADVFGSHRRDPAMACSGVRWQT